LEALYDTDGHNRFDPILFRVIEFVSRDQSLFFGDLQSKRTQRAAIRKPQALACLSESPASKSLNEVL
jgi:hypothetical protein